MSRNFRPLTPKPSDRGAEPLTLISGETMAEPRRVQLSSVSSNARLQPPSPKKPHMEEPDSETSVAATVRIALTLFEPDQKKCPEFFYPELMRKLQRNEKRAEKLDKKPLDPFSNEDAERKEVEAISKKLEEKYGKKRRRDRMQDLVDIGYGYDESDSFIDNSEAYDELVPASLTTKYGGFYINTGTLQFRQASESEDESVREKKKKKSPKKMKDRGDKVKKRKREEEKKSKKSKYSKPPGFTALNGTKDKKKKKLMANLQEMLARFEKDKKAFEKWTPAVPATSTAPKTSASTAPSLPPPPPREAEPAPDPLPSTMVPESKLLQAANAFTEKKLESPDPTPEKRSGSPPGDVVKEEFKKPPSVPEGLPPAVEKKIKELAKWVQVPDGDKKINLFSPQMNTALLDIYLQSRDLSSGQRSSVFSHLSSILPCSKDMLVRWTSRLYLQKKGERLREPLRKLKEAVAKAMPVQIVKYHAELKVHNEARYAKMLSEDKEKEQKTLSEEEEEEDKGSKKAAGPRKKFQWTEEIRQLLCQLVRMKVDIYEPGGCGVSSLEDYLKSFLDEEVRPLWPRGWMQARTLFRETRRVYPQLGSMMAKNKTVLPPKIRAKESSNKQDKNTPGPSAQGPAVTTARDIPASVVSAGGSPVSADTQDNSLDGDLIHNPPSLDGVSEHLTALSGRPSSLVFEFPALLKSSGSEKAIMVEEKKKPCPPVSATSTLQPSARPVFHKKFMATGSEKKMILQVPSPKPAPETQQKQKAPSSHQPAAAKTQAANPIVQPSVNVYQMSNPATKGSFTHPIQSGGAKVSAPSPSQQPLTPQTKPVKLQGIPPSSSPLGSTHKPVAPSGFIVKAPNNPGLVGAQVYRGAITRLPAPPHGNTSGQKPTTTLNQPPTSTSRNPTTTLNQPPTSTSRNPTTTLNQPPTSTSRNPTTTLNQPPISASRNPATTLNQPTSSASRNSTTTLNQPPSSASRNPATILNQPPISASRNPTTTLNQPTSSASRNPTTTLNQPPISTSRNSTTTQNQPPSSASRNPTTTQNQPPSSASRNPTTTLNQPPTSTSRNPTTTQNQPPTSTSRNASTISAKKPPPQKLTLMAPQTSEGGTQGVAKLLTSSMVAGGGNATSNVSSQKGSAAPGLLGPAPLTILTSSYKQNGVRMPTPAALGLLSPINTFPLHVVSFTTEPPPKARASKDAIVTGPAPGTFHHGLPRSILGGLHTSTGHPSTPIPHQTLSGHMQPAQTDGAHTHNKGTVPSQMRPGRPNNP